MTARTQVGFRVLPHDETDIDSVTKAEPERKQRVEDEDSGTRRRRLPRLAHRPPPVGPWPRRHRRRQPRAPRVRPRDGRRQPGADRLPRPSGSTRWEQVSGHAIDVRIGNLTDAAFTYGVVAEAKPDAIVHFGEQRSAPYSMIDREHAVYTQVNNVVGNLNLMYAIAGDRPRHPPRQARDDGRVRLPQHRHRRGLHRDHPQGPHRRAALPQAARLLLPPVQGARQRTTSCSAAGSGACAPPT